MRHEAHRRAWSTRKGQAETPTDTTCEIEMSGAQTAQQDTVVEPQSIRRPTSKEQSSHGRFMMKSLNHKPFKLGNQLKATIFNSWLNLLLIAAPIGIATYFMNVSAVAVFIINFIAIIPLAALLSHATEEIALRVGQTLGGLLNATFGFVYILI